LQCPAFHELRLSPGEKVFVKNDLGSETMQRRMRRQHASADIERSIAGNRLHIPNVEISRDRPDSAMKQTVCHCRIQQRGDNTSMKNTVISLEFVGRRESRSDAAVS